MKCSYSDRKIKDWGETLRCSRGLTGMSTGLVAFTVKPSSLKTRPVGYGRLRDASSKT